MAEIKILDSDATTERKESSLQERLSVITKRLDRIDTTDSQTEVVDYVRVGDRVSVIIRPRPGNSSRGA